MDKIFSNPKHLRRTKFILGGLAAYFSLSLFIHRYQRGPNRNYMTNLTNQIIIITGASAGIGKETARDLAKRGGTIIFACRDQQKTELVIEQIKKETHNNNLYFMKLVLDNYESVREFTIQFIQQFNKVDILINNAGIVQFRPQLNSYNHDQVFATNHLGHFLLTYLLKDKINNQGRVINVSSFEHVSVKEPVDFQKLLEGKYKSSYGQSKYCNVVFTRELQKYFDVQNKNIKTVALHPGVVRTEIFDKAFNHSIFWKFILKNIMSIFHFMTLSEKEGAMTTLYTALMPFAELQGGAYYSVNQLAQCSKYVGEFDQGKELWDFSFAILNI